MNNYLAATDEYCYKYTKYPKVFTWKAFKRFGFTKGQVLCEKYDIKITEHRTKGEAYKYYFDLATRKALKFIKEGGKNQGKFDIMSPKKHRPLKIATSKPYDFDKMNTKLLGVKRKVW